MADCTLSLVQRLLRVAHERADTSALKQAFAALKGAAGGGEAGDMDSLPQSARTELTVPSSLFIVCCEEAIALAQWGIAEECIHAFHGEEKAGKSMQARALYCEGIVRSAAARTDVVDRFEAVEEQLACAGSVLAGLGVAIEDWPRSAEVVVTGLERLWMIVGPLFNEGHYHSVLDVLAFVLSLHERLMIGGAFSHLQWTERYATCLRGVGQISEAIAQWQIALSTAARLHDDRMQIQILRALVVAASERDAAAAASGSKTAKNETPAFPKSTPHGYAVYVTQLFLSGYYHTGAGASVGGLSQARRDLWAALERLEEVQKLLQRRHPTADGSASGGSAATLTNVRSETGASSSIVAANASTRPPRQPHNAAQQQQQQQRNTGATTPSNAATDSDLTDGEVLEELVSDVVLCLALVGEGTEDLPAERGTKEADVVVRLLRSANMRARTFARYTRAVKQPGCNADTLRELSTAPDTAYLTTETRLALLRCVKEVEAALGSCHVIVNASECDYARQVGCAILWAVMQPLLLPPGVHRRYPERVAEQQQLRGCLHRMADELAACGARLPVLQTAVEYQCSLLELEFDNIALARRRAQSALRRLPASSAVALFQQPEERAHPASPLHAGSASFQSSRLSGAAAPSGVDGSSAGGAADGDAGALGRMQTALPMDFPLAWLRHRIDVRAALDASALPNAAARALRCVEEAMSTANGERRITLLKLAFAKLPPLLPQPSASAEAKMTSHAPPPSAVAHSGAAKPLLTGKEKKARQSVSSSARHDSSTKATRSAPSPAHQRVSTQPQQQTQSEEEGYRALPDAALAQLYAALLAECCADSPVSNALLPVASAVAEALLAVPVDLVERTATVTPSGSCEETRQVLQLARMQGEAALFLAGRDGVAGSAPATNSGEASTPPDETSASYLLKAAELGRFLCEHGEAGAWLCLDACDVFLHQHWATFESGSFAGVGDTLEKLYDCYHSLPPTALSREGQLTADIGVTLVLSLLFEYVKETGEVNGELHATSLADFSERVLRYPKGDSGNARLRKAVEVATLTARAVPTVSLKAQLCMLVPLLQRLTTGNAAGNRGGGGGGAISGSATSSSPLAAAAMGMGAALSGNADPNAAAPDAQEALLLLIGCLCAPGLTRQEKAAVVERDGLALLKAGPPTVQLCGRLAVLAEELRLDNVLLELCDIATALYKAGNLGWARWWVSDRAISMDESKPRDSGGHAPAHGKGGGGRGGRPGADYPTSVNVIEKASMAPPDTETAGREVAAVSVPTPEDWYWYAYLLQSQATVYYDRCNAVDAGSAARLRLRVLALLTNSAIAAARAPASRRRGLVHTAYGLFYKTLSLVWSSPGCSRHLLIPSLRMMLSEHVLDPALVAFDASKKTKLPRSSDLTPATVASREGFRQLLSQLGVVLLRCFMSGRESTSYNTARDPQRVSFSSGGHSASARSSASLAEASAALRFLRLSLPARWQRELASAEAGYVASLGLSEEAMSRALKGCDRESEALAWCRRASLVTDSRQRALEAWSKALSVMESPSPSPTDERADSSLASPDTQDSQRDVAGAGVLLRMAQHLITHDWVSYGEAKRSLHTALALLEGDEERSDAHSASERTGRPGSKHTLTPCRTEATTVNAVLANRTTTWLRQRQKRETEAPRKQSNAELPSRKHERKLSMREVVLAFDVTSALWSSLAPQQQGEKLPPAYQRDVSSGAARRVEWAMRDYALLMVHYVLCMWYVAAGDVCDAAASSPVRTTAAPDKAAAVSTACPLSLPLPTRASDWLGFTPSPEFVAAAAALDFVSDTDGDADVLVTLMELSQYLAQEAGLEHLTFLVVSWCHFCITIRSAQRKRSSGFLTCVHRVTSLSAQAAALRCGAAGHAAQAYHVGTPDASHWFALRELLAPAAAMESPSPLSQETILLDGGAHALHDARGQAPAVVAIATGGGEGPNEQQTCTPLVAALLLEIRHLTLLGRLSEADVLVDMLRRSGSAREPNVVVACALHDTATATVQGGAATRRQVLEKMSAFEKDENGAAGSLRRCDVGLRVEWLRRKCTLLAALAEWDTLAQLLASLANTSTTTTLGDGSFADRDKATVATAMTFVLSHEAVARVQRSCLNAVVECILSQSRSAAKEGHTDRWDETGTVRVGRSNIVTAESVARQCIGALGDTSGAFAPSLPSRMAVVSALVKLREASTAQCRYPWLREPAAATAHGPDETAALIVAHLHELKEEADAISSTLEEVRRCLENSDAATGSTAEYVPAEGPVFSGLSYSMSSVTRWQAQNAWERIMAAEELQRIYRSLSLAEMGLPMGEGPAHLEPFVADYVRDPSKTRAVELREEDAAQEESCRLAAAWREPVVERPAELVNAFAHFGVPVQLLDGASRFGIRVALLAARDMVPADGNRESEDVLMALVRLEFQQALEVAFSTNSYGKGLPSVQHGLVDRWSRQPSTMTLEMLTKGAAAGRGKGAQSSGGVSGTSERRLNAKRDVAAAATAAAQLLPSPGTQQQLSDEQRHVLACGAAVARAARMRFDFTRLNEVAVLVAHLCCLWGQPTYAAAAAEVASGARLGSAVLDLFSATVGDTEEGVRWRTLSTAMGASHLSAAATDDKKGCFVSSPAFAQMRAELLSLSPTLQTLESIGSLDFLLDEHTSHSGTTPSESQNQSCRPQQPESRLSVATPLENLVRGDGGGTRVCLPDGSACLTITLAFPSPWGLQCASPEDECGFFVILHLADGTTEARLRCIPCSSFRELLAQFAELLTAQRARLAEKDRASDGACAGECADNEMFFGLLAGFLDALDVELVVPLLGEWGDLLALYAVKQPLVLCLDPLLQPLPLEHAPFLASRCGSMTREISVRGAATRGGVSGTGAAGHRALSRNGVATASGTGGGHQTLLLLDPLGDHRPTVEALLSADGGGKVRGGGAAGAVVLTAGGLGLPVTEAAMALALQQPSVNAVVLSACGPLPRALPARVLSSVRLGHVQAVLMATGSVNHHSAQREAKSQLIGEADGDSVSGGSGGGGGGLLLPQYTQEWLVALLALARGVRFASLLWYPLPPRDSDTLCRRSLPGLHSGKGISDYIPSITGSAGGPRVSTASLSKSTGTAHRRHPVSIQYGVRPGALSRTK